MKIVIYKISPGYRGLSMWEGDPKTNERMCRTRIIPNPEISRVGRYHQICDRLNKLGVKSPIYTEKRP